MSLEQDYQSDREVVAKAKQKLKRELKIAIDLQTGFPNDNNDKDWANIDKYNFKQINQNYKSLESGRSIIYQNNL